MAKSLLEEAGISSNAGPSRTAKSSKSDKNGLKLGLAIGLFIIALGLIVWYEGWFTPEPPPPPPPTQEQTKARQDHEKQTQQQIEKKQIIQSGS